ncbi:MAG TPA: hypothetical protein VER36_05240 [Flavisolibacter sp.]|nr:hypothetical protein [Flavisolibacter sp.]
MPTQSFLSTDFFLLATEEEAKDVVLSLPRFHANISLLKENTLVHSIRFLFEHPEKQIQNYIDVSILPLNDMHVLVKLHGSYTNGKRFHTDPEITSALRQFENAVCSLLKKDDSVTQYADQPTVPPKKSVFSTGSFFSLLFPRSV